MDRSLVTSLCVAVLLVWSSAVTATIPVLVLPAEFTYYQMSAGGVVDALPDESNAARMHLHAATAARLSRDAKFREVPMPDLTHLEQVVLDEHLALFEVVAHDAATVGWSHKRNAFDYTIGPGLAFLADRSGADKAVVVVGNAVSATGGRVAMAVFAAATVGAALDTGGARLVAGIVDLRTGAIEWVDTTEGFGGRTAPTTEQGAALVVDRVMLRYPQSRLYRARVQ